MITTCQIEVGSRFGLLVVTGHRKVWSGGRNHPKIMVKCDCGSPERAVLKSNLLWAKSCGCLARKQTADRSRTHGMVGTLLYRRWKSMNDRCKGYMPDQKRVYSDRGITVCDRWKKFQNFLDDMGHPPTPSHQIDRIDNHGGYSPENCRWATPIENSNNTRKNVVLTFRGKTQTVAMWARDKGWIPKVIHNRLRRGWTLEATLTQEPKRKTP